MAKNGAKTSKADDKSQPDDAGWSMDAIPEALRDAGKRAAELAQNPYARSLLAAGLVAAAAALASNKNAREATRRNLRTATEAAEAGAENVGKVGIAIVNAATDAVQRMMKLAGATAPDANRAKAPRRASARAKGTTAAKTRKPAAEPAAKKPAAANAATSSPRKTTKPATAKPARKPPAKKGG